MSQAIPLYEAKAPFIPAANKGFGYQGILLLDEQEDLVQCHVCGDWFRHLGGHLRVHETTARAYKKTYGLRNNTALCNEKIRVKLVKQMKRWTKNNRDKILANARKARATRRREGFKNRNGKSGYAMEIRNKTGDCPEQLLTRIQALASDLKRTPHEQDLLQAQLSPPKLRFMFGSVAEAMRLAGLTPRKRGMTASREAKRNYMENPDLILELFRNFRKQHGRWPSGSDHKRAMLPAYGTIHRYFGSVYNLYKILGIRRTAVGHRKHQLVDA